MSFSPGSNMRFQGERRDLIDADAAAEWFAHRRQ